MLPSPTVSLSPWMNLLLWTQNTERTEVGWYALQLSSSGQDSWDIRPMNMYLYDGLAGILLILYALELYEEDTEMKKLLLAQILYFRGEVEKSSSLLNNIYEGALDFDAKVGLEMMRALCALHQGDIAAWQDVKQQMKAMLDHCADQREQLLFWTASIDSMIDDATAFPQWFKKGELNILPSFLMAFF